MSEQLLLGITPRDDATFDNFYPARNVQILQCLQETVQGRGEGFIYLYGDEGVGCSHLLQAACHFASVQMRLPIYLPIAELIDYSPDVLTELEQCDVICLDGIEQLAGHALWEEALFYLFNRARERQTPLIVASNVAPSQSAVKLADLRSRLAWGLSFAVQGLSDDEKIAALQMRGQVRGMALSTAVCRYLLGRLARDMGSLLATLDSIDAASLKAQRRITVPFVRQVLDL